MDAPVTAAAEGAQAAGRPLRVLSLGGGTQSCALALMSARGDLERLDHVIFADTQGEMPETYEYLAWLSTVLHDAGIPMTVVTAGSLEEALLSPVRTKSNPTPPAHVLNPDGSKGRIGQYRCSYDYKRRMIEAQVKRICGGRGDWKRSTVEQWIGFSVDEMKRMKQSEGCRCGHPRVSRAKGQPEFVHTTAGGCSRCDCDRFDPWQVNRWPLIEMRMRREDTIRWFARNGYPTPPRSACWFCPNSGNDRWQDLRDRHPELFERAVRLDGHIRDVGSNLARGNQPFAGQMFLHGSLTPLADADLRTARQVTLDAGQQELFNPEALGGDCEAGVCFT